MCNDYANHVSYDEYRRALEELDLGVRFPAAAPNLEPRDDIRPTDPAPVIRATEDGPDFAILPWGFPPARPRGPPVINFRSEKRRFPRGRCLVPASWFYEFTGSRYPKTKWRFDRADGTWLGIAGLWRPAGEGAAFTMLTVDAGPDIAPYHDRQVVVLERADWAHWLDMSVSAEDCLKPSPAGRLVVRQAASGREAAQPELAL